MRIPKSLVLIGVLASAVGCGSSTPKQQSAASVNETAGSSQSLQITTKGLEEGLAQAGHVGINIAAEPAHFGAERFFALATAWADGKIPKHEGGRVLLLAIGNKAGDHVTVKTIVELDREITGTAGSDGKEFGSPGQPGSVHVVYSLVGDFDNDDRRELNLVIRSRRKSDCGTGYIEYHKHYVVNLEPTIELVFEVTASQTGIGTDPFFQGSAVIDDLNGDGHADIAVRRREYEYKTGKQSPTLVRRTEKDYLWSDAKDRWILSRNQEESEFGVPCKEGDEIKK